MTEAEKQRDLKVLQDAIFRDKVLRARAMTPEERLDAVFELTNSGLARMMDGAMARLGAEDESAATREVARRIDRLRSARDLELASLTGK